MSQRQLQLYPDKADPPEWRWRRKAANGRTTATSGDGYKNRRDALAIAQEIKEDDENIVLLDRDGKVVGELVPVVSHGPAQEIDIAPASETGNARGL